MNPFSFSPQTPVAYFYADCNYTSHAIDEIHLFIHFTKKHPRIQEHLPRIRIVTSEQDLVSLRILAPFYIDRYTLEAYHRTKNLEFLLRFVGHLSEIYIPLYRYHGRTEDAFKRLNLENRNMSLKIPQFMLLESAHIASPIERNIRKVY